MVGLVDFETLESLRLTTSEGFDVNCWGEGGAILLIFWEESKHLGAVGVRAEVSL